MLIGNVSERFLLLATIITLKQNHIQRFGSGLVSAPESFEFRDEFLPEMLAKKRSGISSKFE